MSRVLFILSPAIQLSLALLCALAAPPKGHAPYVAHVIAWHDADTPFIKRDQAGYSDKCRVRFADAPEVAMTKDAKGKSVIDPERSQPGAIEALEFTRKLVGGKQVTVTAHGMSYDRPIVDIHVGDKDVATEMVRAGHAWVDERYTKSKELLSLQAEAKAAKRGLWAEKDPTPPWEWRKGNKPKGKE